MGSDWIWVRETIVGGRRGELVLYYINIDLVKVEDMWWEAVVDTERKMPAETLTERKTRDEIKEKE